jgi:exo-beta-1,3-glucanase (GH17 family)
MKLQKIRTRSLIATARAAILVTASAIVVACGGSSGGIGGTGTNGFVPSQAVTIRPLSPEYSARNAVNYGSWRTNNRVAEIAQLHSTDPAVRAAKIASMKANILQDMQILIAGNIRLIRLFNAIDDGKIILEVINDNNLDMKVQLGTWIEGDLNVTNPTARAQIEADNLAGIVATVDLAKRYPNIILAVSVGNEALASWSGHRATITKMAAYIKSVRDQITQPVTTDDYWGFYAGFADSPDPVPVLNAIDFAAIHIYPINDSEFNPDLWDWKQKNVPAASRAAAMMAAAMASAKEDYNYVRAYLDLKNFRAMPIVVSETGWKATQTSAVAFRAHPVNQQMNYADLNAWKAASRASGSGPLSIIWFAAFDEPWKGGDDGWGLFNVARQARYAVKDLYPSSQWEPGTAGYTAANAVYFIPPVLNTAITANRYTVLTDGIDDDGGGVIAWNAWDGNTAVGNPATLGAPPGLGTNNFGITPTPKVWGWGMFLGSTDAQSANLSNFKTTGKLNFWARTTYPGKIEVGIRTLDADGVSAEAYIPIANGEHGYCNTGAWCLVSIPLSTLLTGTKGDLSYVVDRIVIADRFEKTGKAQGTTGLPVINVTEIYFSK